MPWICYVRPRGMVIWGSFLYLHNDPKRCCFKRLRGINGGGITAEPIVPSIVVLSLKTICMKELCNGQCFGQIHCYILGRIYLDDDNDECWLRS
ncbi:hypothetical protein LOK49_LG02G01541 [Camellia lanceoleosa]|uniref:Uncharacterized protein n=1 Tax=Camellia lanceoleosa TaxID=1840588 RepID=A0ACC0IM76_9ERIC|nr:hypothetical protein LOK49_LG02G01541 [Camellia lanceoleosa]